MTRPLLQRPWFVWSWGVIVVALNVYTSIYYYQFLRVFIPLLSGGTPALPWWLADERTFMLVWCATALAVGVSFGLFALTVVHAWRYARLSQAGRIIWSLIPLVLYQPGFLAYWVWNVARPLVFQLQDDAAGGAV